MPELHAPPAPPATSADRNLTYRVLRYAPNALRDEWVNIGILLFDSETGERRLRLLEDEEEYSRVRRLHRDADESVLRHWRGYLEDEFQRAGRDAGNGGASWQALLDKWDRTFSGALHIAQPKLTRALDLDAEMDRLYADRVAIPRVTGRAGLPGSRGALRSYCSQVFRQARLWDRLEKSVPAEEFTFPGDPMRLDYSYHRNGTRGFVQTLSVTRAPAAAKEFAYTAQRIAAKSRLATEFAAVTDVPLAEGNERHLFVRETLRDAGIAPVPLEGFAVWVAQLRPLLLQ